MTSPLRGVVCAQGKMQATMSARGVQLNGLRSLPVRKAGVACKARAAPRMVTRAQATNPKVGAAAAIALPSEAESITWNNGGDLQPSGEWRRNLDLKVRLPGISSC